jgi:Domain of unknown function (DUF6894)
MPRYFFHVRRGGTTLFDREGVELADIEEAAAEAARRGREIAMQEALKGVAPTVGMIVIDEGWRTVLEIPFDDA